MQEGACDARVYLYCRTAQSELLNFSLTPALSRRERKRTRWVSFLLFLLVKRLANSVTFGLGLPLDKLTGCKALDLC